jgi:hypothetical protein
MIEQSVQAVTTVSTLRLSIGMLSAELPMNFTGFLQLFGGALDHREKLA